MYSGDSAPTAFVLPPPPATGGLLHVPENAVRAVYYNIAFGISYAPLTVDTWGAADWRYWADRLVQARLTHVYFYLWGGGEVAFPASPACNTSRVLRLHRNLQAMIGIAHGRGLQVGYMLSPTMVPRDIWLANRNRSAESVYAKEGFPDVCQADAVPIDFGGKTWPSTMALIKDVYGTELEYFAAVDEVLVAFYDPGGCFCTVARHDCRGHQAARMVEQVAAIVPLIKRPETTRLGVVTWATWAFEATLNISYREAFFELLRRRDLGAALRKDAATGPRLGSNRTSCLWQSSAFRERIAITIVSPLLQRGS